MKVSRGEELTEDEKARVRELVAEEDRLAALEAGEEEEAEGEEPEVVGGEGEGVEEGPRRTLGWCTHTHTHTQDTQDTERERERARARDSTILLCMQARRSMVYCRR